MSANPSERASVEATAAAKPPAARRTMRTVLMLAGIILIAVSLRAPFTGVGPLLAGIRVDLGLSAGVAGLLTSLPLFAFGLVSPLAPPLARRLGLEVTLMTVLVVLAVGIALRWLPSALALFAGTALLGAAIAVGNVMMPSLVKREFPQSIGLMTGIYVTIMALFGALASGVSVPITEIAPGGWRTALGIWLVPTLIAIAVWSVQLGRTAPQASTQAPAAKTRTNVWRSPLAWQVTAFMGLQSLSFYVMLAWLPTILQQRGFSADYAGWLLFMMQSISSLSGMAVPLLMHRGASQQRMAMAFTLACFVGYIGLTVAPQFAIFWVLVLAPGTGGTFVLALSFIALRAGGIREAVALSGMAQGVGYFVAACGPVVFGFLHDLTGMWTSGMLAVLATTALQVFFGYGAGRDAVVRTSA